VVLRGVQGSRSPQIVVIETLSVGFLLSHAGSKQTDPLGNGLFFGGRLLGALSGMGH
jgi:hypothetical protein